MPIGILWKVNVLEVILGILIYTILQANRMYSKVLAQCVVGDVLGRTGQDVVRAFSRCSCWESGDGRSVGRNLYKYGFSLSNRSDL